MSAGAKLDAGASGGSAPFVISIDYDLAEPREESYAVVSAALNAIADATVQPEEPRIGCVGYAFARPRPIVSVTGERDGAPDRIHMTEVFASVDAQRTHLTENEGEAIVEMYTKKMIVQRGAGAVNVPEEEDIMMGLRAGANPSSLMARLVSTRPGGTIINPEILDNRWYKRYPNLRPKRGAMVMLDIYAEPTDTEGARERLADALAGLIPKGSDMRVKPLQAFVADAWWPVEPPFTEKGALGCRFIFAGALGVIDVFRQASMAAVTSNAAAVGVVVTAENWDFDHASDIGGGDIMTDLFEHLHSGGLPVIEEREVFAGYLLHPAYTAEWHAKHGGMVAGGRDGGGAGEPTRSAIAGGPPPPPPPPSAGGEEVKPAKAAPFTIRYHAVTGVPESLLFARESAGAGAADGGATDVLAVPLRQVMTRLARLARSDREMPIGMAYAQLERLRRLLRDAEATNALSDAELDGPPAEQLERLMDVVSSVGYSMPATGRVPIEFTGLAELVATLETEFAHLVGPGRAAVEGGNPIEYMALQELFPIGSIVVTRALGALGGAAACFRVADSYYEPMRSNMGGRKYGYRLVLQTVVLLGGEFVVVQFPQIFDEWKGAKELRLLPFVPLPPGQEPPPELRDRARALARMGSLGKAPAYLHYRAGCFFAHRTSRTLGGASAGASGAAPGRLILDSLRGLELGHSPAAAVDEVGNAIAGAAKALRDVNRAFGPGAVGHEAEREERLASAGLTVLPALEEWAEILLWPTVVAFSLTIKTWGHVLLDGLDVVKRSASAWDQLVLPDRTKEMLLAMAETTKPRGGGVAGSGEDEEEEEEEEEETKTHRYKFRDIIDARGGGVLFLLYGPPGTGKTLSVEALALLFGRPLYTLSFAELGASVAELEERLTDVLSLAAQWGALVLLDEGDALVEKRQRGQLLLNSMTGVLLRLLETFDGALFITSNRASSFDPAALSRVTLAIRYPALTAEAKAAVWRNALGRVLQDDITERRTREEALAAVDQRFNVQKLAQFSGSGRAVGSVVRLAIGLCHRRHVEMSQSVVEDALSTWRDFHQDLANDGATEDFDD